MGAIGELRLQIALGGVILTLSLLLFFAHLLLSWFDVGNRPAATPEIFPPALSGPEHAPAVLENLKLWTGIAIVLIVLTYILPLASIISGSGLFGQAGTIIVTAGDLVIATFGPALGVIA